MGEVTATGVSTGLGLSAVDYGVFAVYLLFLLGLGYWLSRRTKSTDDYFRGGKRVPWWAAGISILATKLSAVSFMSLPVKAFYTDWLYFWIPVGNILLAVVVVKYIIPFFCRLDITSAYQYLEWRFNSLLRVLGSITYLLFELARMGVLLLLPAIVVSVVTGLDIYWCIVVMGIVATLYTILGGIEAVIWTDVLQVFIMVGGAVWTIVTIVNKVEEGPVALYHTALEAGKFQSFDWNISLTEATTLVILLSWIGKIQDYISNQTVVQRFVSTHDERAAGRSMWMASLLGIPVYVLFLLMGTGLFYFYQEFPERLTLNVDHADALLPTFIVSEMPTGVIGLVIGAIFAAAMSSLDSGINSMSTVLITDIYQPFFERSSIDPLKLAQGLTALLGAVGTGSALIMAGLNVQSLYDQLLAIIGLFGGGLAGMFILGIFTQRANSAGTLVGFFASGGILFYVSRYTELHVFLYALVGMGSCVIIGYLASLFLTGEKRTAGLTVYTLDQVPVQQLKNS